MTSSSAPSRAARNCCVSRRCRPRVARAPTRALIGGGGRRGVHHHPQVLPRREGRPAPDALRATQHRGDRRRGAPQPVRLHRRLRAAYARRTAACLVHRLHRHADRVAGRQHPRRVRRLHQRLRHPARGRGRRHGADLLREPARQVGARRGRAAEDRPGFEEATEGEEVERKEKLKTKWAQLEAVVGAEKR